MSQDLDSFLGELSTAGDSAGEATSFTLRSDKAKEKLKKFALAHPENYFLLIIAALHALGARNFVLRVDADDLELSADCRIGRGALEKLWSEVAGGGKTKESAGLRVLGLAILTSVRFEQVDWTITSRDEEGGFCFKQEVVKGDLPDPILSSVPEFCGQLKVAVKRRNLRQVATRFLRQLSTRWTARLYEEEQLVLQRVFLGVLESFEINKKSLDCRLAGGRGLGILRVAEPPLFLSAKYDFEAMGGVPMVVFLAEEPAQDSHFPGEAKKINWLWHGLKMGVSDLGLSYPFLRVFVAADALPTDLSFSAVADTWERQKAERLARDAARQLLEKLVETFHSMQKSDLELCEEPFLEQCLLQVARERITVRRDRRRLASFNRAIVACPLFWASDPEGAKRRFSLSELWEEIEKGRPLAAFFHQNEVEEVPPWPDRPVVLYGSELHLATLKRIFGTTHIVDAGPLARRLNRLSQGASSPGKEQVYQPKPEHAQHWQGTLEWRGLSLQWILQFPPAGAAPKKGSLHVCRSDKVYFVDESLQELPENFIFYGELPWEPDYRGLLKDEEARRHLPRLALHALVSKLESLDKQPEELEVEVAGLIWSKLGGKIEQWSRDPSIYAKRWMVVQDGQQSLAWTSPQEHFARLDKGGIPHYYTTLAEAQERSGEQRSSSRPPGLVLSQELAAQLSEELPKGLHHLRGLELLEARPPFEFDHSKFLVVEPKIAGLAELDRRIERVRVGFPTEEVDVPKAGRITLQTNLRASAMQQRHLSGFVGPATVCIDWNEGWPDSRGCHFVDKSQQEVSHQLLPSLMARAVKKLFAENKIPTLATLCSETLSSAWLEAWSESSESQEEILPLAGGSRASVEQVCKESQIFYFTDPREADHAKAGALWLPESLLDNLDLLHENKEWVQVPKAKDALPGSETEQEKTAPIPSSLPLSDRVASETRKVSKPTAPRRVETTPPPGKKTDETSLEPSRRKQDLPRKDPEPAAPAPAQRDVLEPVAHFSIAGLAQDLQVLLKELELLRSRFAVPHFQEFRAFLSAIELRPNSPSPLSEEDETVVLREWQLDPEKDQSKILILLSALFSVFNRKSQEVSDAEEREFHRTLLNYGLTAPGR